MSMVETVIFVLVPGANAQFKSIALAEKNSYSGEHWNPQRTW